MKAGVSSKPRCDEYTANSGLSAREIFLTARAGAIAFSLLVHTEQPLPTWLFLKKSRTSRRLTVHSRSENALLLRYPKGLLTCHTLAVAKDERI